MNKTKTVKTNKTKAVKVSSKPSKPKHTRPKSLPKRSCKRGWKYDEIPQEVIERIAEEMYRCDTELEMETEDPLPFMQDYSNPATRELMGILGIDPPEDERSAEDILREDYGIESDNGLVESFVVEDE